MFAYLKSVLCFSYWNIWARMPSMLHQLTSSFAMRMSSVTLEKTVGWMKKPLFPPGPPPHSSLAPSFFPLSISASILSYCSLSIWMENIALISHFQAISGALAEQMLTQGVKMKQQFAIELLALGQHFSWSSVIKDLKKRSSFFVFCFRKTLLRYKCSHGVDLS